jgi:exodeoxyribonuclease VII large subunit
LESLSLSRKIHTVSEVTGLIKTLLEDALPFVWISGEISNFKRPASGHFYFTLKDENAQIRAVMFKGQSRGVNFDPADGLKVIGLGRIAVYEPQGVYQFILEHMEPAGVGALALAFEQLKSKLSAEGLFDNSRKKPLPFLPRVICVITSRSGAVIHDILHVLFRRFENVAVEIFPVAVQGANAAREIVSALQKANERFTADVIIVARGGGSLEDLAAFNSEELARAVFASEIPVVSAVGHETDFTICDFVADLRAPTPTAAAQMVVPEKASLLLRIDGLYSRNVRVLAAKMERFVSRRLDYHNRLVRMARQWQALGQSLALTVDRLCRAFDNLVLHRLGNLDHLKRRLIFSGPRAQVFSLKSKLESRDGKLLYLMTRKSDKMSDDFVALRKGLITFGPASAVRNSKTGLHHLHGQLVLQMKHTIERSQSALNSLSSSLAALSPEAVLARGYSITRPHGEKKPITNALEIQPGALVDITLCRGQVVAAVKSRKVDE